MENIRIERVSSITKTLAADLTNLLSELSETAPVLEFDDVKATIHSDAVDVFVAYDNDAPAGMLTVVFVTLLSGKKCIIEDVVVSSRFRRRGIAAELVRSAVTYSRSHGARYVDLTSRPERVAANELYQKLGFIQRQTHVYRLAL
ncbi:GNAT family N-acetyltransferase [Acerihabitans sp. TG2]|uniref:GNAT family N-acetyltransferase n=1 Tax=Acerihabitans sp. TG2 TaxID=3096008 RepID=UPI002B22DA6F|nr:GNAT family N-acetyltransferase [Acerihabitans sp. TG2]MEA9391395.1 GNAT family N-acetyltransferase [Acerihabitans sp. TG2]